MNRAQNSSSLPHALCTRQFYRRKKPLFEIGSLLFDATRMPQARPSTNATTANLEPYRRQAQVYPSDRGLLLGLNHRRCHRCRLSVFFARFATLRQSPPIAKTKILTFLQLFSIRDSLPFPQSEKGPFCSFFTAFLGHDLRFFVTRQSAIEKKLHPDPIFCFWALGTVPGWHRGAVAVCAAKQKARHMPGLHERR